MASGECVWGAMVDPQYVLTIPVTASNTQYNNFADSMHTICSNMWNPVRVSGLEGCVVTMNNRRESYSGRIQTCIQVSLGSIFSRKMEF